MDYLLVERSIIAQFHGRTKAYTRVDSFNTMSGRQRRTFLSGISLALLSGCAGFDAPSTPQTEIDVETSTNTPESIRSETEETTRPPTDTFTSTPESAPVSIEITNYSSRDLHIVVRVLEYNASSGDPDDYTPVAATPDIERTTSRVDVELDINADARRLIESAFTLDGSLRRYYVSVSVEDVGMTQSEFTIQRGYGFQNLSVSLMPEPEFSMIYD